MRQSQQQRNRARQLRKSMTDAERLLWRELRNPEKFSAKFRRQCPIGPYVVDFVCLEQRLIIEVDGSQHQQSDHDVQRTEWLEKNGFRVLRFWNNEVMQNRSAVCEVIWQALVDVKA
ncbi:MAG: endonuclease domain-containing protein [Permianibacter sp.]